jgi:hypothetical protein
VAAALAREVKPSGVYLGVGPEQNFTYIVAMRPRIAFITDIRRGNLHLHLLYKALFEMSNDRASFVGRLFGRRQPAGLSAKSSAAELMRAYVGAEAVDAPAFQTNLKAVVAHLTETRAFRLEEDDIKGIEYVYRNFYQFGPSIHYTSSIGGRNGASSYAAIMMSTDRDTGAERTYLATEANFALIKAMQQRNLIVPVVGDFAGPKALRGIGSLASRSRRRAVGLLCLERGGLSAAERRVAELLRQRRDDAAGRIERLHPAERPLHVVQSRAGGNRCVPWSAVWR